jgi:hypothetical protein
MTRRRGYRLRDGDQIPTYPTTSAEIMSAPTFGLGVADACRAALPPRLRPLGHKRAVGLRARSRMGSIGADARPAADQRTAQSGGPPFL